MTKSATNLESKMSDFETRLLGILDEKSFFDIIAHELRSSFNVEEVSIYLSSEDKSIRSFTGETKGLIGEAVAGHVLRTKRAYFSNNTERDPLFSSSTENGVKAELCVPLGAQGMIMGTVHMRDRSGEKQFGREDVLRAQEIFDAIRAPLENLQMFITAKALNDALLKQIEEKEVELEKRKGAVQVTDSFKIKNPDLVGQSDEFRAPLRLADKVAATTINVLIQGEAGSGKETFARRIHCNGTRKDAPFIVVDCSVYNEGQLEAEIFGEEISPLNNKRRAGGLELAHTGTLFLDKVETLPLGIQTKLLHFIKDGIAVRVGAQVPYKADTRIVAASCIPLIDEVEKRNFREDLFYSLNTVAITLPALRERQQDIEVLANYFMEKSKASNDMKSLSPGAVNALKEYTWPGNIRELQNVVERAFILSDGMIIEKTHLPEQVLNGKANGQEEEKIEEEFIPMTLNELEKRHIVRTLDCLSGNKSKTAKTLGITVKTLYNKLHSYGMIQAKEQ